MTHTRREWSRSERMVAAAFVGALLGLWAPMPAAAEGDKPAPPPSIFELKKPQVRTGTRHMPDSHGKHPMPPPPPPVQERAHQPDGSMKNLRTGITIALRNVCAPGDMEHEAALAAFKRSQARKSH